MRTPKYRVYVKHWGDLDDEFTYIKEGKLHIYFRNWEQNMYESVVFQQFTGLLDKNGKEIYEGDLLSFRYLDHGGEFTGEVKYSDKFASFIVEIGKAFETISELLDYAGSFKVVGHKYETQSNE